MWIGMGTGTRVNKGMGRNRNVGGVAWGCPLTSPSLGVFSPMSTG